MKNMTFKRSKLGFTLAELLLVIAILAVLVGLGVTGFVALRQNITIAKYDDLAREIYVAAQNQLTRMEANGLDQITLNALDKGVALPAKPSDYAADDWEQVKSFYRYAAQGNTQPMTVLLPLGAVADDVRTNGHYVIEYNVQTRTVYGVFYSANSFDYQSVSALTNFRTSRSVRKDPMVGYYGGSAVERDPLTHCEVPKLEIINNNELRLNILNVPADIANIRVSISDGEKTANPAVEPILGESGKRTVLLDSILESNKHFYELFPELTPGKDLKITVIFEKTGAISSSATITANSLFATREHGTDGDVVTLAWARHLQNLEYSASHLDDPAIVAARQTEHIQWEDSFGNFKSISNIGKNEGLRRFEGNGLEIRDLKGSNGLFAQTKENMQLSGIRIVNPVIIAVGTAPVGALAGTAASGTVIHECGVYANKLTNTQTIAYNDYKNCYVDGKTATTGGLVGQATNPKVTYSFAALPALKGGNGASLIGLASNCTISNSYANCDDLQPTFSYFLSGGGNTMTHCYAVGNVASAHQGGFCGTSDSGVTDCYYAVSHRQFAEKWADNKDLAATQFCYKGNGGNWITIDQEQMQNATQPGGWAEAWTNLIAPLSHPYREYLNGRAFPYPAIGELDHYGSWPDSNGTVNLKIDMTLLNNESAGYAIFAGQVIVKDESGTILFDSNDHKNPDGSFDGQDTIQVTPGTKVTITIGSNDGYKYIYTTIDGTRFYPTAESTDVVYTVNRDTEAVVTFRQEAFTLIGKPAEDKSGKTIKNGSYGIDLTSPVKTLNITTVEQSEDVETGSKVTVRPKTPGGYSGCVVWYVPEGKNAIEDERIYLTPDADGNYTFEMPAVNTEVHVMYTDKQAFFNIEYYLMDTEGHYPAAPTQTADYKCGLGSQINQSMINALAESSGLPLVIDGERVRFLEHAVVTSQKIAGSNTVFESTVDKDGKVTVVVGPHITTEVEMSETQPYLVKIYIARRKYSVTLTADTHVDGVRFGNTGDFQRTVTKEFHYGATVTAQADVAPGYHFTYWDPQDSRFMMSADPEYTFQVPQFNLNLKATAATDRYLVTINLLENDESWLFSDPSRQADPITLTLVNSEDPSKTYPMQVLTEDTISYAMQAVVPSVSDYGAGYYVRVDYASGLQSWIYTSGAQNGTDEQNEKLLLYVRDQAVERTARFYSVTYYPNKQIYAGTVPKGGSYPMYYHLTVQGNTGLLRNLTDEEKIFSGWKDYYAEGTGSDTIYTGNEILMVTRRTDMFAQWQSFLTVVYNGNGADGGELPVDLFQYRNGETVTVKFGSLTRKGYRFLGWSTDKDAAEATYTATGTHAFQMSGTNVTLYAVWELEEYTVQFCDTNGNPLSGEGFTFTGKHYGDQIPVPNLTVAGEPIIGWSLTRGGEIVCRPGEQYAITGDAKLYACVASQRITVTYQSGDGSKTYKTEQFGLGIPGYLNCVPENGPVTAWSTKPNGKGTLYFCDESGRSEEAHAFMENTILYAVTGKVYNYNEQLWFDTLYAAVRSNDTQSGHTLIVYRDTEETRNIWINKSLYIMSSGNRTVKWKDGATNDSDGLLKDEMPKVYVINSENDKGELVTRYYPYSGELQEFVGCMSVSNNGNAVTVEFGKSDIPTLSMEGSTLTFDANRQSRVVSLGNKATFHMYDGVTLTNGYRNGNVHVLSVDNKPADYVVELKGGNGKTAYHRSGYGGGVYAGAGSVFYMHGGTVSFCESVSGGGVYLITGSKMYMGDMVPASAYSATAIYYTKVHDERLDEDVFINTDGVTQENFKQYYVTAGDPRICYNESTQDWDGTYGDGGGGLLMLDLNNGELTLFRGSITNNTTSANGGGIVTDSGDQGDYLRIYEVDISHNTAKGLGGGILQWQGTVYVYNSTIRQNKALMNGGGIYLKNGSGKFNIEFYFGDISDNEAAENGGGVYAVGGAEFFVRGGNLCRNKAQNGGGAYLAGGKSHLSFEKGTISGNTASSNGGGVYSAGITELSGGTLSNNRAENYGGGIYAGGTTTMTGGTICDNSAKYLGGGIMVGGQFNLSGGSLYGNTDTDYKANRDDEDNVNPGPNDIYLMGDQKITIPDGGIKLSGEERVAVDCERDETLRFTSKTLPHRFAVYANNDNYKPADALYFTYHGTRSTQYSITTLGKSNLTVATHENVTDNDGIGLYLVEEQAGAGRYSYVLFDLNYPGCSNPAPKTYRVGTVLNINEIVPNTTRPGYYLAGWARTPDAVEEQYALFYDVEENAWKSNFQNGVWTTTAETPQYTVQNLFSQTLYAMWRPCVAVYDVGEQAEANGVKIQPTSIGPRVTILNPNPTQYTLNGKTYYFKHWVDAKGNEYKPMQQVNLTENLRLSAVWEERVANTFVITFYFNDGSSDQTGELRREVVVKAGDSYKIDVDIHQANKILVGWAPNPDGTGTGYEPNGTISNVEHDLSLYAVWANAVTLTYDVNGGDGNGMVESVAQGTEVPITDMVPERFGYIFQGWATAPDAAEAQYYAGDLFAANQNTTLYAVWKRDPNVKLWNVSFDLAGGTGEGFETVEILDDTAFTLPMEKPAKEGLSFMGWEMGTFGIVQSGSSVRVTSDVRFTAVWGHTVTFDLAGGTWAQPEMVSVREGSKFTIPEEVPVKDGFVLMHWKSETGETFAPKEAISVLSDMKLTAVWGHAIAFDPNGGTDVNNAYGPVAVLPGSKFTFPKVELVRDGYVFKGWSEDINAAKVTYTLGQTITVDKNMNLYAVWAKKVKVTFNLNGGDWTNGYEPPEFLIEGEEFTLPDGPYQRWNTFRWWEITYANGDLFTREAGQTIAVSEGMTIKAIWRW